MAAPHERAHHGRGVVSVVSQFSRFAVVGVLGFLVDTGVLYLLLALGLDLYASRALSIGAAATFTWFCNRRFSFRSRQLGRRQQVGELARYLAAMALGGVINFGVYSLLVWRLPLFAEQPVLAVILGTGVSMVFNFVMARALLHDPESGP